MGRREQEGAQPLHPPVVAEPGDLLGQQDGVGQLHHLRRLDAHRHAGEFQPRPVPRAVVHAEPAQQGDEPQAEQEKNPPLLREVLHIHIGEDEVRPDPDDSPRRLDNDPAQLGAGAQIVCGAGDEHDPESRADQTQPQQDHVRLLHDVFDSSQQLGKNGHSSASRSCFLLVYHTFLLL